MSRRRIWTAVLAGLLLIGLDGPGRAESDNLPVFVFLETVNADRAVIGLEPIAERAELSAAARAGIETMVRSGVPLSKTPPKRGMRTLLEKAGYIPDGYQYLSVQHHKTGRGAAFQVLGMEKSGRHLMHPGTREIGIAYRPEAFELEEKQVEHFWQVIVPYAPRPPYPNPVPDLLTAMNAARAKKGLNPLTLNEELGKAATAHVRDLVARQYRGHVSPEGDGPKDRVLRTKYRMVRVGEILAYGPDTPEAAIGQWDGSPGHAKIMYDPDFEEVGFAYDVGPLLLRPRLYYHVWGAVLGRALPLPSN